MRAIVTCNGQTEVAGSTPESRPRRVIPRRRHTMTCGSTVER